MSNHTQPLRAEANALDRELKVIACAIDPQLRRAFTTWGLRRIVIPAKRDDEMGKPVALYVPSLWTLIALSVVLLRMIVITGPSSPLLWAVMLASAVVALWCEFKVVPRIAMLGYSFRLLRFERLDPVSGHSVFTAARWGKETGFCRITFAPDFGIFSIDQIIAVVVKRERVVAQIYLNRDQRLTVYSEVRKARYEALLSPLSEAVEGIVREFGHGAHCFTSTQAKVQHVRTIRAVERPGVVVPVADAWAELVLEPVVKEQLISSAMHFANGSALASQGLLLYGPPGTGKTEIAKALAASMGCAFLSKKLSDLKAEYIGQSASRVKAIWSEALGKDRAVLFIDECDAIFARRDGKSDEFVKEIVGAFIAEWGGFEKQSTVWVVGATNRRDAIDEAVLSRFGEQIEIGLPAGEQRVQILKNELGKMGISAALPAQTAQLTQGMAGRNLASLAGKLARKGVAGDTIEVEDLAGFTGRQRREASAQTDVRARWDTLILQEPVMRQLQRTAKLLQHAEHFRNQNLTVPQAMLLFGPPGTGKTEIARTLANETGLSFLAAATGDLKGTVLGDSAANVKRLFQRARESSPALIFLDEIDVLAPARGGGDMYTTEIVGQLLQEMDGVTSQTGHVFVLAATNLPDAVDNAVLSRFAVKTEIPLPDMESLKRMLEMMLAGKRLGFDLSINSEPLCAGKSGWSGRDLRNWVRLAEQRAMDRALDSKDLGMVVIEISDFS